MERRIRPDHENNNVEGADVPTSQLEEPSLTNPEEGKSYARNPLEIPGQVTKDDAPDTRIDTFTPVQGNEPENLELREKSKYTKRVLGAVTIVTVAVAGFFTVRAVGNDTAENSPTTATAVTTTTETSRVVLPPPNYETTTTTAPIPTVEIPKAERVYTIDGEPTSLKAQKEEVFTVTKAEAPTPEMAVGQIGPMLSGVANFGIHELNQGLHNQYINPKTGEKGVAAYNKEQLLNTTLLDNTGLKESNVSGLNLLNILVELNKQNISNYRQTDAVLSGISIDGSAPAMHGKKTYAVQATLELQQQNQGSGDKAGSRTFTLSFNLTSDDVEPTWTPEPRSFSIIEVK